MFSWGIERTQHNVTFINWKLYGKNKLPRDRVQRERKKMMWKHWIFWIEMVGVFTTCISQNMDVSWTKETPYPFK